MKYATDHGKEDVISWVNDGRAVLIRNPKRLIDEILPYYFSHTKIRSLERQFNMWHFERVTYGPYKGAWMHPYFQRDNRSLCSKMSRILADNPWKLRLQQQRPTTLNTILQDGSTSRLPPPRSRSYVDVVSHGSLLLTTSGTSSSSSLDTNSSMSHHLPQQLLQLPPKALSDTELDVVKASFSIKQQHQHQQLLQQQQQQQQHNSQFEDGDQVTFAGRTFHFLDGVVDNGNGNGNSTHTHSNTTTNTTTTNQMLLSLLEVWGQSSTTSFSTAVQTTAAPLPPPLPIQHHQQEQQLPSLTLWTTLPVSQVQQQQQQNQRLPSIVGSNNAGTLPMERLDTTTTTNAMDLNFMDTVADTMNFLQANSCNTNTFSGDATTTSSSNKSRVDTLRTLFLSEAAAAAAEPTTAAGAAGNDTTKVANINIDNFTSSRQEESEEEESEADRLYRLSLRSLFLSVAAEEAAAERTAATNDDTDIEDT